MNQEKVQGVLRECYSAAHFSLVVGLQMPLEEAAEQYELSLAYIERRLETLDDDDMGYEAGGKKGA